MNFKKIEIYGFKSFADKIAIEFNGGVNCIVGPNGCGKSNVADAIRWVLGEQSARVLRAQKSMSEIIFNGTKNRRSLSYCEVSMFFDNEDRTYAVDIDELVITRKLYRSGESEYYINNEKVRLREIVDLFRDTGIGREGYSIIAQGKIADILSAKPDERRQIFEEAAGISKFKAKRIIAERKLAQTRENMLRIFDRISSLERDLGPLEKEADDAKRAKQLKEELKLLEVNTFIYQSQNNAERKKEIIAQSDVFAKRIQETQQKLGSINAEYEKIVEEINNTDENTKELYEKRLELSLKHQKVKGQHDASIEKLEELKKKEIELSMESAQKERALEEAKHNLEGKKTEKDDRLKELVSLKQQEGELISRFQDAERDVSTKTKELEDINRFILSSSDEKGEIKAELATLKAQIDGLTDALAQDKQTLSTAKLALADAQKKKKQNDEELKSLQNERQAKSEQKKNIDGHYCGLLEQLEDAQSQQNQLRQDIGRLNTRAEMLEDYKKNLTGYADAVRRMLTSEEVAPLIEGVVGKVITVSPNLQVAIEIALGRSLQNIITRDEQDTAALVNFLKKNDYGRATFLALSKISPRTLRPEQRAVLEEEGCVGLACDLIKYDRKYRSIFGFLLGGVVIVEDMRTGTRLSQKYHNSFRIVTLDGEDFAVGGATTGGSKPKPDTSILQRDALLKDVYKDIASLTNKHNAVAAEIDIYKAEMKKLEENSSVLQNQLLRIDKDTGAVTERCANTDFEVNRLTEAAVRLQQDIDNKQAALKEKQGLFSGENTRISEAESKKVSADELLARLRAELAARSAEFSNLNNRVTEFKLKLNSTEHTIASLDNEISAITNDIKYLSSALIDLKARKCTNDAAIESLNKQLSVLEMPQEEREELIVIAAKIKEIDEYKLRLKDSQEKLRGEENGCKSVLMDLSIKKSNIDNLLQNLDNDMYQLAQKISEDYELDYESALALRREDFSEEKGAADIRKIKRELSRLGDINEKAVEQFTEKSGEYEMLSTHYKDISDSEQSLVGTISELTTKMETIFKENFDKINENFQEIFKEIFDGGKGMLQLDVEKGGSVLDAGIDIFAEPPGKQLRNISLLSGGERALTAIAILFAIIKLKPMPFCVLDEIEAALDDANAYLFAQYLRKFAGETQFVVITHRKPTMELADCLYGVTMQEKGISKIVRVKLSTALSGVS